MTVAIRSDVSAQAPSPSGRGQGEGAVRKTKLNGGFHAPAATKQARGLRAKQTDAEKKFWHEVKAKRFEGYKFRRQYPIGKYIADFVCVEAGVIVEIDGGQHCENVKDDVRTEFLNGLGYHVVRFWNNDILNNLQGSLQALSLTLSQRERGQARKAESVS